MNTQVKEEDVLTAEKRDETRRLIDTFNLVPSKIDRDKILCFVEGVAAATTGRLPKATA